MICYNTISCFPGSGTDCFPDAFRENHRPAEIYRGETDHEKSLRKKASDEGAYMESFPTGTGSISEGKESLQI